MSSVFRFKQFSVKQESNVFKVGTDAVLLGALVGSSINPKRILEVGTGTGIIALMLAQRFPGAEVVALDSDPNAAELASQNFNTSPFTNRMHCFHTPFQLFESLMTFDLIVSNPPFFESGTQGKLSHARHTKLLSYRDLAFGAANHLSTQGQFVVILPFEVKGRFSSNAEEAGLHLSEEVIIRNSPNAKPKRVVLHFTKKNATPKSGSLLIRESQNTFSHAYKELTKAFHPFL
jgi:tRNA1Val (adenine37-N6)-methyltransferase